jgi:hypothetical protein
LALPARELVRVALGVFGRQAHGFEQLLHPLWVSPQVQAMQLHSKRTVRSSLGGLMDKARQQCHKGSLMSLPSARGMNSVWHSNQMVP